jgi:hypothetical protein
MNVKKAPKPMLMTPMNVIIIVMDDGVIGDNPMTIPMLPVAKNIIIKTLTLVGSMYLISGIKMEYYYKLAVDLAIFNKNYFQSNHR